MAKKSKRRGNQTNKKRASQAPSSGTSPSAGTAAPTSSSRAIGKIALTKSAAAQAIEITAVAPDLTPVHPLEAERDSQSDLAPASERRTRSAGMLPPPQEAASDESDDVSIPPVTPNEHHSELEDSFFVRRSTLERVAPHHDDEEDLRHSLDPRSLQKMSAAAHARREHLTRYVKWAVGGAAAIAALAMLRVAVQGKPDIASPPPIVHTALAAVEQGPSQHEIEGQPGQPQAAAAQPNVDPSQPAAQTTTTSADQPAVQPQGAATQAAAPQAAAPQAAAPQAVEQPAAAAVAPAAEPVAQAPVVQPAAPADAPAKTALQERNDAQRLLERGNAKGAIEAGARSVALDPTDGEAWLLLGASYQQVGKNADARKAFQSCLKEGKKGPLGECKEMLQ